MKLQNLKILKDNGFNVPEFTISSGCVTWEKSAVRSSADIEDSENNSCAGLFDSFLNVSREELNEKIELVRESYARNGVRRDCPVIIQKMANSELSGVLFTANPMGILNEMVIVVGRGLGCNVVEDKVNTTTYCYNVDDNFYDCCQNGDSPLLSRDLIKELVEQGKKIESLFSDKMDIEFGIENGKVVILQARPITTLSYDNLIVLDNSNIVESYPGVSLPLTQSFVKDIYYKIFRSLALRLSEDESLINSIDIDLRNMVDVVNGRIYYRINNWYSLLKLLPNSNSIIKVWQEMLGVRNLNIISKDINVSKKTKSKIISNFLKYLRKCPKEMKELEVYFDSIIKQGYRDLEVVSKDDNSVLNRLIMVNDLKYEITSHWDITLINDMYAFLNTSLAGKKNQSDLGFIGDLASLKPIIELNKLVEEYHKSDKTFSLALRESENLSKFDYLFFDYIDVYGDRCLEELKLETATYRTNPELLYNYLKEMPTVGVPKIENKKSNNIFVERAKLGISNREISRMNRSRLFGLAREVYLRIGEDLVEQGRLNDKRDIFYLFEPELSDNGLNYKSLVEQRKLEYAEYKKIPDYSRLVFTDKIINKQLSNSYLMSDGKLLGVGISKGIVEGEVLVINEVDLGIDTSDKIIVTKMTDPGWIFLIKNCKGLIVEQGSLLSHTAIVSRELKKPAVVNVKNAMQILKTGDIVRLDGLRGEISIVEGE